MIGKLAFPLLVALSITAVLADGTNYCDKSLCEHVPGYGTHVACSSNSGFSGNCMGTGNEVKMDAALQDLILDLHNKARAKVANGQLNKYGGADRMIEVKWNDEFALMAGYNARDCNFRHDYCRNTKAQPYVGQNIAMQTKSNAYPNLQDAIRSMFNDWFKEYEDCSVSAVKSYSSGFGKPIGHFTQIANNKVSEIGCAITTWKSGGYKMYFVCNYSLTNISNEPIFTIGKAGSKCEAGRSERYPGLCSIDEAELVESLPYALSSKSSSTSTSSKSTSKTINGNTVSSSSSSSSSSGPAVVPPPAPAPTYTYTPYNPYANTGGFNWAKWNF